MVALTAPFPWFGDNLSIGGIFTVVSIVRSYVLRRVFNGGWR